MLVPPVSTDYSANLFLYYSANLSRCISQEKQVGFELAVKPVIV